MKRRSLKKGVPPGSLIHIGEKKGEEVNIHLINYDQENLREKQIEKIEDCLPFRQDATTTWINVDGLHSAEIMEGFGKHFGIHPLTLEDINTTQRPKKEDFDDYIYLILKMMYVNDKKSEIEIEQVSLILGDNYVITFQERIGDVFDQVRQRIRENKGRIRRMGADYLVYTLLDAVVDRYFIILEHFDEILDQMEDELLAEPTPESQKKIHVTKRDLIFLRRAIWPLREVIGSLGRGESKLFKEEVAVFLRDIYDHTIQVIDAFEMFREMISGMHDLYLSSISNRMNEIMKTLTIIATIFIPLTFIAGIYGMNFKKMPELEWSWGYPMAWLFMIAVVVTLLFYFKRKKWF